MIINMSTVQCAHTIMNVLSGLIYYLNRGDYVFGSICLFVRNICSKSYERIAMKFYEGILGGKKKQLINFGGEPDHHAACRCPIRYLIVTQQIIVNFDKIG